MARALCDNHTVVVGAGLAGLATALRIAEEEPVVVLSAARLGAESSTWLAQGGLAAAVGPDDTPELHAFDTLAAGHGLCDPARAAEITAAAAETVARLEQLGAAFDRDGRGALKLGLEAAHSRRRIVHGEGDATGRVILSALIAAVGRSPNITCLEGVEARAILTDDAGAVAGVLAAGPSGEALSLRTARVALATGGIGGLYRHSTNPLGSIGRGLALAARVGATLADLEFVQFHPTALDVGVHPMPLVSEAVRGEGARLVDARGEPVTAHLARGDLEPRDVVARAVAEQLAQGRRVFLDACSAIGPDFPARFPTIASHCLAAGIDPTREPIPVRPAAHYHMGGVRVDAVGRSSTPGLWACGEVASTGLHGANRLASNSLLEAAVAAGPMAEDMLGAPRSARRARPEPLPTSASAEPVRGIMEAHLGIVRNRAGLQAAAAQLMALLREGGPGRDPALVGLLIAISALRREESRGAHFRADFPAACTGAAEGSRIRLADLAAAADLLAA